MPKMALKRKLTKEEFDKLSDAHKELYKDRGNNGSYVLDAEADEDVEPIKSALEREKKAAADAKRALEQFKDVDPARYAQLVAEAEERDREGKKKSNDWEGWKLTFEEGKKKEVDALNSEIATRDARIRQFLLVDKARAAFLEAGGRKASIDRMIRDVLHPDRPRFRLDEKENIEVLDEGGNPMDVKLDSFFKDKYSNEAPEMYEATGAGGSGASNTSNGSLGGVDLSKLSPTERLKAANRASS